MISSPYSVPALRPATLRYAVAAAAVLIAWACRPLLEVSGFGAVAPFIFFFPAIAVACWYGGLGPAILALAMSVAAAHLFFLNTRLGGPGSEAVLMLAFTAAAGLIVAVMEASRRSPPRTAGKVQLGAAVPSELAHSLLATTLSNIGDAFIVTDSRGRITFLNQEAERLTGWAGPEAEGKLLSQVFRTADERTCQPSADLFGEILRREDAGPQQRVDGLLVARDGREIPIARSTAPIRDEEGHALGAVVAFRDLTIERKAEETRARLAAIVQFSGDVIVTKSLNGIIQTWNASAERLFGYSAAEIVGKPVTTLFPQERLNEEDHILGLLRQGKPCEKFETVRVAKNGRRIPVFVSVSPLKDHAGNVIGASKIIHDITDLVAAREALEAERELLNTTLASIGDGVIVTDPQGRVTFLNAEAQRLTGWRLEEATGKRLPEVFCAVHEQTREPIENPVDKVARLGGVVGLAADTVLISRDGIETPIDDSVAPIRHAGGDCRGVVLVFRDFTARRQAEREQQQLYALVEAVNQARCLPEIDQAAMEAAMQCLQADACALFVGEENATPTLRARRGIPEQMVTQLKRIAETQTHRGLEPVCVENTAELNLGSEAAPGELGAFILVPITYRGKALGRLFLCFRQPQAFSPQKIRVLQTIASQVGFAVHRRCAEEELEGLVRERTTRLREMVNELEHVSYAITHDMRAPLRAMSAFASAALEEASATPCSASPALEDYCRRIIAAAARLDRMIQDSLHYTRTVLLQTPLKPVDLGKLIPSLVETYPNLQPEHADIIIRGPLPVVLGEESLLTQSFSNLLGNAVKFVAPGVRPRVVVSALSRQGFARITVEDNGIGIHPRARERLFGMFERLTADYEGTGIGLAIVRKVVERMGGSVGAESELGKGSRFWVELRTVEASEGAGTGASSIPQPGAPRVSEPETAPVYQGNVFPSVPATHPQQSQVTAVNSL